MEQKYNNDGLPVGSVSETVSETITDGRVVPMDERPIKRRFPWFKIAIIMALVGGVLIGIGHLAGGHNAGMFWSGGFSITAATNTTSFTEFSNISNLYITSSSARIIVEERNQGPFGIHLLNIDPEVINISGNTARVNVRNLGTTGIQIRGLGFYTDLRQEIRVYVPGSLQNVNVQSSSGRVTINGITAVSFDTATSSGRLEITNTTAENLTARTSSGALRLNNIIADTFTGRSSSGRISGESLYFGSAQIESSSGAIVISDITWTSLNANSSSGRINLSETNIRPQGGSTNIESRSGTVILEIEGSLSNYRVEANSNSGSIVIDGERARNGSRRSLQAGTGNHNISLRTSSGRISVQFD